MCAASFIDRLVSAVRQRQTPLLVGLDPRVSQLPAQILADTDTASTTSVANAYREFCRSVIDVVAPLVPAVKPQAAFFEQLGPPGMQALADVIAYAREQGLLVILDAKRNDIGSTAEAYAEGLLGPAWNADAVTVSPYLGQDSLEPFVAAAHRFQGGLFVLVKTSNPGGALLQDLQCDGRPLYRRVGEWVETWAATEQGACGYGSVGGVVGATYPEQLAELRSALPHTWFLVPGLGAQGGTAADVAGAFDSSGLGALVNSSRAILFAYSKPEYAPATPAAWQSSVEAATQATIGALRSETPAANLGC